MNNAKAVPSTMTQTKRLNFNIWPTSSETGWIDYADLDKQGNAYLSAEDKSLSVDKRAAAALEKHVMRKPADLSLNAGVSNAQLNELDLFERFGRPYCGFDAAIVEDLTALCMMWVHDGIFETHFRVWCPDQNIVRRSKEQRVNYQHWADAGFITPTPGDTMDQDYIFADIVNLHSRFNIRECGFDRQAANYLAARLASEGHIKMTQINQGYALSEAIQYIQKAVKDGKFLMFGHPVAKWCFSNVQLQIGYRGDVQIYKQKCREKIDCAAAAAMAMEVWLRQAPQVGLLKGISVEELQKMTEKEKSPMTFETITAPVDPCVPKPREPRVLQPDDIFVKLRATGQIKRLPKPGAMYLLGNGAATRVEPPE